VTVQVEHEGARVTGRGVATDVVEASARAYLQAVNKAVAYGDRSGTSVRRRRTPSSSEVPA
jgi:2-isopropylmalate synthase